SGHDSAGGWMRKSGSSKKTYNMTAKEIADRLHRTVDSAWVRLRGHGLESATRCGPGPQGNWKLVVGGCLRGLVTVKVHRRKLLRIESRYKSLSVTYCLIRSPWDICGPFCLG